MMTIPYALSLASPLLQLVADKREHDIGELTNRLAQLFEIELTNGENPSDEYLRFESRVAIARDELIDLRLLRRTSWGRVRITKLGARTLRGKPGKKAGRLPKGLATRLPTNGSEPDTGQPSATMLRERIEADHLALRQMLADGLTARILQASPRFFEYLCVDLLVAMGYSGGSRKEVNAQVTKASGDEGIDGIVRGNDKLNLYTVYIQAKRYTNPVGRPMVQEFEGSLAGIRKAVIGVFITTSRYTREAREYVARIDRQIVLIDGKQLVDLMIEYKLGVLEEASYPVNRLDEDYFKKYEGQK